MPSFPALFTVTKVKRTKTGEDSLGQPTYDETRDDRKVYCWYGAVDDEKLVAEYGDRVINALVILGPDGDYEPHDAIEVDGNTYEVMGYPINYNTGPFGYAPGFKVVLQRVTDG